ncbi:MAG: NAD(P)-dependent oxidoreductase [Candidatus Omnitrophica bacterium]|nr:NAD(P)-dependent oxidoreductase [Candidatus Omnitrophota bacterium]
MKKIGITGAAGNIGTTHTEALRDKYELTLFDLKETRGKGSLKFIKVDLAERNRLNGIFKGLDCLIHLAGNPRPDVPAEVTIKNNFIATSYVFQQALEDNVKKIIFASSNFYHQGSVSEALSSRSKRLITLDMPPTPGCPYAESKVFAETIGRHLSYLGMQFIALRIGWTVPEDDPSLYAGEYMRAVFCSKRDLAQAFLKAIEINTGFLAAYAVSKNTKGVFDLAETRKKLGFDPQDDAEKYF